MNGLIWDQCGQGVSMIRPDGGIPEEIRRSTTCDDTHIEPGSAAHHYLEGYLAGTISQAELCLRRGDRSLYDNVTRPAVVPSERPSISCLTACPGTGSPP